MWAASTENSENGICRDFRAFAVDDILETSLFTSSLLNASDRSQTVAYPAGTYDDGVKVSVESSKKHLPPADR